MHPAFYVVDHRIGLHDPVPLEHKTITRRGKPEALRLSLPPPGAPFVNYAPVRSTAPKAAVETHSSSWLARFLTLLRHAPAT